MLCREVDKVHVRGESELSRRGGTYTFTHKQRVRVMTENKRFLRCYTHTRFTSSDECVYMNNRPSKYIVCVIM